MGAIRLLSRTGDPTVEGIGGRHVDHAQIIRRMFRMDAIQREQKDRLIQSYPPPT